MNFPKECIWEFTMHFSALSRPHWHPRVTENKEDKSNPLTYYSSTLCCTLVATVPPHHQHPQWHFKHVVLLVCKQWLKTSAGVTATQREGLAIIPLDPNTPSWHRGNVLPRPDMKAGINKTKKKKVWQKRSLASSRSSRMVSHRLVFFFFLLKSFKLQMVERKKKYCLVD